MLPTMNNRISSSDDTFTGAELGSMLRSENRSLRKVATDYIEEKTQGLKTEKQRADALGVSLMGWGNWRRDGLVKSIPEGERGKRGRPRSPTEPVKLELGKQWIVVDWVMGKHGSNGRTLRKAEFKTSTGHSFSMPSWEGSKFVEAMVALGWEKS